MLAGIKDILITSTPKGTPRFEVLLEDRTMNSLQSPFAPDATYRNKSGKSHRGYVANMEDAIGKNGSVVTDYQFDKNTHTDSQFLQETLSAMEKVEEEIILVTDGGYDGRSTLPLQKRKVSNW